MRFTLLEKLSESVLSPLKVGPTDLYSTYSAYWQLNSSIPTANTNPSFQVNKTKSRIATANNYSPLLKPTPILSIESLK